MKEKDDHNHEVVTLKQEHSREIADLKQDYKSEISDLKKDHSSEIAALKQDHCSEISALKQEYSNEIATLKQDLGSARESFEQQRLEIVNSVSRGTQQDLEEKLKETVILLTESKNKVLELESFSESSLQRWSKKESMYQTFTEFQLSAMRVCLLLYIYIYIPI